MQDGHIIQHTHACGSKVLHNNLSKTGPKARHIWLLCTKCLQDYWRQSKIVL